MTDYGSSAWSPAGIVAASHPLAVRAGLRALEHGGSAADAAVAAAAVLTVVDARSTGLGGDLFAMYWPSGSSAPVGMAAAGHAPSGLTVDAVRRAGHSHMPHAGPWSVTVPGAPAGWATLLDRFGLLDRETLLAPAVDLALNGSPVAPIVAAEWQDGVQKLRRYPAAAAMFLLDGVRAPAAGEWFAVPSLGRTLQRFITDGPEPFYRGDIAADIAAAIADAGGVLTADDLADWSGPTWTEPISVRYAGVDVFQMPPPGQGLVVAEALKLYEGIGCADVLDQEHAAIESIKLAYEDAGRWVADPAVEDVPVEMLLSPAWLSERRSEMSPTAARPAVIGRPSDTVFIAVATPDRGACSLIQSVYESFGSGVGVAGRGIVLQNRASGFVLDDEHPNRAAPRKRPYHTIIPAMLGDDGAFLGALGVVGGYMQPQGQFQILRNVLERGMYPQAALDAPRFRAFKGHRLGLEDAYPRSLAEGLRERGHHVESLSRKDAGGAQLVMRIGQDFVGGSDRRKDGYAGRVGE